VPKGNTGPAWFADVSAESGVDFLHDPGPINGSYFFPQSVGPGVALFDFDNDGRLDVYLQGRQRGLGLNIAGCRTI
jgi:enediyne biosynthesis protein E4